MLALTPAPSPLKRIRENWDWPTWQEDLLCQSYYQSTDQTIGKTKALTGMQGFRSMPITSADKDGGRLGCIECHGYCERWKVLLLTLSRLQKSIKMQLYKLSLLQWKISSSKGKVRVSKCSYMSIDLIICLVRKPGKDPTGIQTHSPGYPIG